MSGLKFSPAAIADIDKIWNYTAKRWGPDQANLYTDTLRDAPAILSGVTPVLVTGAHVSAGVVFAFSS